MLDRNEVHIRRVRALLAAASFTLLSGCRMGAPLHVWSPPQLQSTVGKAVMVPKLVGPSDWAEPIHNQLVATAPKDRGRSTELVSAEDVKLAARQNPKHQIALVSYDEDDESDLALMMAARDQNFDFVLRGQILPDRHVQKPLHETDQLRVSWSLVPIHRQGRADSGQSTPGWPIVVDLESALEKYPDLIIAPDSQTALQAAMVRETLPLLVPTVDRVRAQIEIPYLMPGSKLIRQGNGLARSGDWAKAETVWQEAHERYPFSSVAVHNLAIAAVARQDFATARRLARKAIRMKPTQMHQETLVWVERLQRAYHEAFELSDPPEGWFVTRERVPR